MGTGKAGGVHEYMERELKWSVDADFEMPDIAAFARDGEVRTDAVELSSTYYDTADDDLRVQGIVMRRRDGDDDTGWQVKLPTDDGRLELHWPLTDTPPEELLRVLRGAALGEPLSEVATIRTHRQRHVVVSGGAQRFEVADDAVRASVGDALLAWREVEVELGPDERAVPKKLLRGLRAAGARTASYPSKLARAVGAPGPPERSRAAAVLGEYVDAQLAAIVAGDVALRRGQDPIHDTRVAIRRLRSVLRVFADVIAEDTDGLDAELRWLAGVLGDVRDPRVQQERFSEALGDIGDDLILGPVRSRIRSDLRGRELRARTAVDEALDTGRHLALLATLRQWRGTPPFAADLAAKPLVADARRAGRKARRRLARALEAGDPDLLHGARKAAKRARYAAELVSPFDSGSARWAKRFKQVQTILGDHQDAVVALEALRRMGAAAGSAPGENGFTFGLLYAREERVMADARVRVGDVVHR